MAGVKAVTGLLQLLLSLLSGWLLAQTVLAFWQTPVPASPARAMAALPTPSLLAAYWQPHATASATAISALPVTRLPLHWLGQLREQGLEQSIVVLGYGDQRLVLGQGDPLAPGIWLERIDSRGLIIDNNGRRERLFWPQEPPLAGVRRLDG